MNIIGICGRANAGKTTIANYVCSNINPRYDDVENSLFYVLSILFDWKYEDLVKDEKNNFVNISRDEIWNFTVAEAITTITKLFHDHIDTNFQFPNNIIVPIDAVNNVVNDNKFIEMSFAGPLKKIAVVLNFPGLDKIETYNMLVANTKQDRDLREIVKSISYDRVGEFTGRTALEYMGTDMFRKNFDEDIWIKILTRNAKKHHQNIIISDVRFKNEEIAINALGGKIIVIYKDMKELMLSEQDQKTHPSKWNFLLFLPTGQDQYIHNNADLPSLYKKIDMILNKQ